MNRALIAFLLAALAAAFTVAPSEPVSSYVVEALTEAGEEL